jgi:CXXX repeat modification system protein
MILADIEDIDNDELELYEDRKNSLYELKICLDKKIYIDILKNIDKDLLDVELKINQWWDRIIAKYNLSLEEGDEVNVRFIDRQIVLINSK